jgi:hypothetical protein
MCSIKNARLVKSLEIHKGTAGGTNSNLINFQLGFPGVALQTGEDLALVLEGALIPKVSPPPSGHCR